MLSEGGVGYLHVGPGTTARKDPGRSDEIPLGMMPTPEALAGLPCAVGRVALGGSKTDGKEASSRLVLGKLPLVKGPAAGAYVGDGMPPGASQAGSQNQEVVICGDGGIIVGVLGRTQGGGGGATKGAADEASSQGDRHLHLGAMFRHLCSGPGPM